MSENVIPMVLQGECVVRKPGARTELDADGKMPAGIPVKYEIVDCDTINATQRNAMLVRGVVVPLQSYIKEQHEWPNYPRTIRVSIHALFSPTTEKSTRKTSAMTAKAKTLAAQNEALNAQLVEMQRQLEALVAAQSGQQP